MAKVRQILAAREILAGSACQAADRSRNDRRRRAEANHRRNALPARSSSPAPKPTVNGTPRPSSKPRCRAKRPKARCSDFLCENHLRFNRINRPLAPRLCRGVSAGWCYDAERLPNPRQSRGEPPIGDGKFVGDSTSIHQSVQLRMAITFVTTTSHGSWLPGDLRGYVQDGIILPSNLALLKFSKLQLKSDPVSFVCGS